jgi:hypothetical protein
VDVDFGVAEAAYPALWNHRHLLPEGYAMYDTGYRHRGPKLYVAYKGWEADIYFYEDRGAELCSYENSRIGAGYSKPFPKTLFYPPRQAEFLGERTFVPNQCQAFLEHVFGYIGADAVQDKGTGYWRKRPEL